MKAIMWVVLALLLGCGTAPAQVQSFLCIPVPGGAGVDEAANYEWMGDHSFAKDVTIVDDLEDKRYLVFRQGSNWVRIGMSSEINEGNQTILIPSEVSGTVALLEYVQTFTANQRFYDGVQLTGSAPHLDFRGVTAPAFKTRLVAEDILDSNDKTVTIPSVTGSLAMRDIAQAWSADQTLATGTDIILATSGAGTMIATAANQKLGFWGATPVVQPANIEDIVLDTESGTESTNANFQAVHDDLAAIKALLRSIGLMFTP